LKHSAQFGPIIFFILNINKIFIMARNSLFIFLDILNESDLLIIAKKLINLIA
jgi:hypothetical protein